MAQVLGIGGFFFRSENSHALAEWYETHLGIPPAPTAPNKQPWISKQGVTIFSPFPKDSDYFPEDRGFMLNFRVADLDAMLKVLNAAGIESSDQVEMEGIGRFARIHDPEGNPIELWEPVQG
ncbi:VOC family protein [Aliiroseovarius sp. S2029]|uniref:VOC family protein n=1 Tax=Aliiroseovarius sp. S2029 TaxID=2936988 RepID=UPI0020BF6121|nr:VOC family protein [Aliiroseovarius sp. S2029]MCK8482958.1 VOC family protein [Aliiroseovarius sp. S2029]